MGPGRTLNPRKRVVAARREWHNEAMTFSNTLGVPGGHSATIARRIVFALSLGCLIAAAGMMIVRLAKQCQETARRNAEKEAAGQDAESDQRRVEQIAPLTIRSERQSAEHGMSFCDGNVQIDLPPLSIQCQHVQREAAGPAGPVRLAGYGGVVIKGVARFPRVKADNFVFDARGGGLLTLAGEVQVEGPDGQRKYRVCTIALDNSATGARIVKAKSHLDDFAESQTILRKLALLDEITGMYGDDELPPDATWLLAMKLLERHLTWHSERGEGGKGKAEGGRGKGEGGQGDRNKLADEKDRVDPAVWPEAHSGEPWMREDADEKAFWRLGERRHVDVLRAVALLGRPGMDAADNERRRKWLTEIQRNNTLLRMLVEPAYRPHAAATVTLDARNADRLTLKLYRVGNGAAWAAVRQRQGRDFIYADAAPARFAAVTETTTGPKKLGELLENLVKEWTVEARQLPRNEELARKRPAPERGSSWYGNRKLAIAAEVLAKPGYYVLAVEANGETAFGPMRVEGK